MNLTTPSCPHCGAALAVEGDRAPNGCKYCGRSNVDLDSPAKVPANLLLLARAATEAGNDEEASTLWSRVLEADAANAEAWLGKAKSISMTLVTMLRGYEQAESYCRRALDAAKDRKEAEGEVFAVLAEHLRTMTTAAQVHFDEFWAVDGAAWEHLAYVLAILDGYDRLADLTATKMAHKLAVDLADTTLAIAAFGKVAGVRAQILERRSQHVEKGGALMAALARSSEATTTTAPMVQRIARWGLAGGFALFALLSFVGWGRWAGSRSEASASASATAPPATGRETVSTSTPRPPTVALPSPAGTGAGLRALGFPSTISFPGDSTWKVLEVVDRGQTLTAVKAGKKPQQTSGRWIVVHFEAANDSNTIASSSPDPRIVDSKGRSIELWSEDSYDNYLRGTIRVLGTEDVKPGLTKDYWAIFEVPPGAPLKLRLHALQGKGIRDIDVRFEGDPAPVPASAIAKPKPAGKTWAKGDLDVCSKQCAQECGEPGGPCNRNCMMDHCY